MPVEQISIADAQIIIQALMDYIVVPLWGMACALSFILGFGAGK